MIDRFFFSFFLHGIFICVSLSAFYLQIIKGGYFLNRAENNYIRLLPLPPERGTIYDRKGNILVRDTPEFEVSIVPAEVRDKERIFLLVSQMLHLPIESIIKTYRRNFLYPFAYTPLARNISKTDALKIEELSIPSVFVTTRWKRQYRDPFLMSHLSGYVKEMQEPRSKLKKYGFSPGSRVGYTGVEEYYDEYLRGEQGGIQIEVDSSGSFTNLLGKKMPQKGKDLSLTIDRDIQESAYTALQGKTGVVIFMDVQTGEVLCCVSSPSYDTNEFIEGKNVASLFSDERRPLLNRAVQGEYPPGSVFKIVTAAAALIEKKLSPFQTHECVGHFNLGRSVSRCWSTHGVVNLMDALKVSCNVYFWNLGLSITRDPILKWARIFGYGKVTGIDLPYERKGFLPSRNWKKATFHEDWVSGDTINLAIGQGFLMVTPLQALEMVSVIARSGTIVTPYIVKKIDALEMKRSFTEKAPLSDEALMYIKDGLVKVCEAEHGTASFLAQLHLDMAGKTGTAQVPPKPSHGWFVGYFPYNAPRYSMVVFLEHGQAGAEAVKVAYDFLKDIKEKGLLQVP